MKFLEKYYKLILFFIPVISLLMHLHIFSLDLVGYHVWRQTETQTVINNFYKEDFNIFHPRINDHADTDRLHRMEFPIMQWLFALFYRIFGNHIIISRVLSFIIGLFSVFGMYYLSLRVFKNKTIATITAWTFNCSPVFYYYTLNPLPDNFALACAIWSVGFSLSYRDTHKIKYVLFSACLLSLATLAKLPFILYGVVPLALWIYELRNKKIKWLNVLSIAMLYVLFIIPPIIWYISVIPGWEGNTVIKGVFDSKDGLYRLFDILQGNLISTLPELLLNYGSLLFFITGIWLMFRNKLYKGPAFTVLLFWGLCVILYFLYEISSIGTAHDYYMFPFLPLLFLLVTYGTWSWLSSKNKWIVRFAFFLLCLLPVTAFIRADSRWNINAPLFNATYYKYKTQFRSLTPQDALCVVGNDESHYILLYYIDRKGWAFYNDDLSGQRLEYYISKGAAYLFIDNDIDARDEIKKHLAEKIFDKETVRIYKLK